MTNMFADMDQLAYANYPPYGIPSPANATGYTEPQLQMIAKSLYDGAIVQLIDTQGSVHQYHTVSATSTVSENTTILLQSDNLGVNYETNTYRIMYMKDDKYTNRFQLISMANEKPLSRSKPIPTPAQGAVVNIPYIDNDLTKIGSACCTIPDTDATPSSTYYSFAMVANTPHYINQSIAGIKTYTNYDTSGTLSTIDAENLHDKNPVFLYAAKCTVGTKLVPSYFPCAQPGQELNANLMGFQIVTPSTNSLNTLFSNISVLKGDIPSWLPPSTSALGSLAKAQTISRSMYDGAVVKFTDIFGAQYGYVDGVKTGEIFSNGTSRINFFLDSYTIQFLPSSVTTNVISSTVNNNVVFQFICNNKNPYINNGAFVSRNGTPLQRDLSGYHKYCVIPGIDPSLISSYHTFMFDPTNTYVVGIQPYISTVVAGTTKNVATMLPIHTSVIVNRDIGLIANDNAVSISTIGLVILSPSTDSKNNDLLIAAKKVTDAANAANKAASTKTSTPTSTATATGSSSSLTILVVAFIGVVVVMGVGTALYVRALKKGNKDNKEEAVPDVKAAPVVVSTYIAQS
jgi:hypothetical protein